MQVHLVLPAYNEGESLGRLLERLVPLTARLPLRVLVVNDGSLDSTAAVADNFASRISLQRLDHPRNLGLGAALQTGLERALAEAGPDDVIVTMDADDTHPPGLIPDMLQAIQAGADVVVASRFVSGARIHGLGVFRRLMSRAAAAVARLFLPLSGVTDFTSGYRAYRGEVLQRAREARDGALIAERGFAVTMELLAATAAVGASFAEVPLVLRYERKLGASKMRVGRTVVATLGVLWRARRRRAAP